MKILQCDSCHAKVDDRAYWLLGETPRNMYELYGVHTVSGSDTYEGMIFCHKCIQKLLHNAESEAET